MPRRFCLLFVAAALVLVTESSAWAQRNSWQSNRGGGNAWNRSTRGGMSRNQNADANDGPSGGGFIRPDYPQYPTVPPAGNSDGEPDVGRIILDGIGTLLRNLPENQPEPFRPQFRPPRPEYYPERPQYYPQPQYRPQPQYVPTPTPSPQPAQVKPNVKPNAKPPERKLALKKNLSPMTDSFELVDLETTEAFQDAVEVMTQKSLDELAESMGDATKDPEVQKELDKIADKINGGEAVTQEDIDELMKAADGKLPMGTDPNKLKVLADDLQKLSDANAKLVEAVDAANSNNNNGNNNNGNNNGTLPIGPTNVIFMPAWPIDETLLLADGSVMIGTGGEGRVEVGSLDATDILDLPLGAGEPEPDSSVDFAKRVKSGVLLMNPDSTGAAVHYVVANKNYSMEPGYNQRLAEGKKWVVTFDRGEGHGEAQYTLTEGTYVFGASDRGWELYRKSFSVTIDNSQGEQEFHYNVDNKQHTLAGGESETHTSKYPILVRFDRGNGEEAQKQVQEKTYTLQVAVNPDDALWDLYPGEPEAQLARDEPKRKGSKKSGKASSRASRLRALLQLSNL